MLIHCKPILFGCKQSVSLCKHVFPPARAQRGRPFCQSQHGGIERWFDPWFLPLCFFPLRRDGRSAPVDCPSPIAATKKIAWPSSDLMPTCWVVPCRLESQPCRALCKVAPLMPLTRTTRLVTMPRMLNQCVATSSTRKFPRRIHRSSRIQTATSSRSLLSDPSLHNSCPSSSSRS